MDSHHNELHHLDHIRALPDVYVRNSLITSSYIFSLFLLLQTSLLLLNMQKGCVLNSDLLESNLKGYFYFFSPIYNQYPIFTQFSFYTFWFSCFSPFKQIYPEQIKHNLFQKRNSDPIICCPLACNVFYISALTQQNTSEKMSI